MLRPLLSYFPSNRTPLSQAAWTEDRLAMGQGHSNPKLAAEEAAALAAAAKAQAESEAARDKAEREASQQAELDDLESLDLAAARRNSFAMLEAKEKLADELDDLKDLDLPTARRKSFAEHERRSSSAGLIPSPAAGAA